MFPKLPRYSLVILTLSGCVTNDEVKLNPVGQHSEPVMPHINQGSALHSGARLCPANNQTGLTFILSESIKTRQLSENDLHVVAVNVVIPTLT